MCQLCFGKTRLSSHKTTAREQKTPSSPLQCFPKVCCKHNAVMLCSILLCRTPNCGSTVLLCWWIFVFVRISINLIWSVFSCVQVYFRTSTRVLSCHPAICLLFWTVMQFLTYCILPKFLHDCVSGLSYMYDCQDTSWRIMDLAERKRIKSDI